jgi:imidazolonepropionase-like amidohydrolase
MTTTAQPNESRPSRVWRQFILTAIIATMVPSTRTSAESFVIRNARVFDGRNVTNNTDVQIEGKTIKVIGKQLPTTTDSKVIDGTGATLMPGLIDAHTHTFSDDALNDAVVFGVTTELDMFSDVRFLQQVKRREAAGKNRDRADIRSAGTLATAPDGHGTEYGFSIPTLSKPAEAKDWVSARINEGSDYIKIVYDDCREYGFERPTLTKETMKAVIDAAHEKGKLAIVHIGTQQQARDAIEAGADGLAHLFADSAPTAEFAAFVANHHVFVVPTLTVLEGVSGRPGGESLTSDPRMVRYLTTANIDNLKKAFPISVPLNEKHAEQATRELKAAGVPILAGTDSPNPGTAHGASLHRELELLVRSGMSPLEALASATSVPAATFHLDDRGQIAAGKRADLVLVKGDPTHDIKSTREIVAVWKAGDPIDRYAYRAKIAKAKEEAKQARTATATRKNGTISDFEDNKPSAKFGAGWSVSTDSIAGGKSTAEMKPEAGGANSSKFSLKVSGKIDGGLPFAWAGVMFSPGAQVFAPANLSGNQNLTFWAKGDGKNYRAMLFTASGGRIPSQQTFTSEKNWKQYKLPLSSFNGTDGHDITAILFVGGPAAGAFELYLDDISLE